MQTTVAGADGTRLFVRSREALSVEPSPERLSERQAVPGPAESRSVLAPAAEPPVRVFLTDGVACDGFIWKYLWEDLAAAAPLTHWHYRGHGRSAPPADPERIRVVDHADDLWRVRQAAGDPPCVLMGHSMGCQVLLENFREHRKNVRGLVLVCGGYGRITRTFHGGPLLEKVLPTLLALVSKSPEVVRAAWSRLPVEMALKVALRTGEVDPDKVRPEDFMPYLKHMTHVDVPMFLKMVQSAGEHTAEDLLPGIDVPVLVVAGERDTFTPARLAEETQRAIPGAELLMVERGSHVAPIEQPELVDARIVEFLRRRVLAQPELA